MSEFSPAFKKLLSSDALKYALIYSCYAALAFFLVDKGLDLTDNGYHLANQMNVATLGLRYVGVLPLYWFSDVVAAGISGVFGGWTLVEMRCVVLVMSAVQLGILLRIIKASGIKLTVMGGLLMLLLGALMTIPFGCVLLSVDYYTLPTLACYFFLLVMMAFFARPDHFKASLLAAIFFLILNLRFPAGVIVVVIPLAVTVLTRFTGKEKIDFKKQLLVFYGLSLFFVGIELLWICSNHNVAQHVFSGDWRNDKVHDISKILQGYVYDSMTELRNARFVKLGLILAAVYSILRWCMDRQGIKRSIQHALWALPYCLAFSWAVMMIFSGATLITLSAVIIISYSFYLILFLVFLICAPQFLKNNAALIVTGGVIPLAIFLGTNTGLSKLGYGMPLLITVLYFMISNLPVNKKGVTCFFMVFYLTSLSFLAVRNVDQFYENVRFSHSRDLTYEMQQGKVKGTFTTPQTGKAIDELLVEIDRRTDKGDRIFTALSIPMIYFAADRQNVLDDIPNFDIFQPYKLLQKKLPSLCSVPELTPKIIVVSKKYVFDPHWEKNMALAQPLPTSNGWGEQDDALLINEILEKNCQPETVWENAYFQIRIPASSPVVKN